MFAGSFTLPLFGSGLRNGLSVSKTKFSIFISNKVFRKLEFLKVYIPPMPRRKPKSIICFAST